MARENVDQVAAIKASLEMMVAENGEIHEYFRDLLVRVSDLDGQEPEVRREKFRDLMDMGAFRFNGLDIRHFAHSQRKPLSPPLFFSRTRRRLKNTLTLVDEFGQRGLFAEGDQLRYELDLLASTIINDSNGKEVQGFKSQVDELRQSPLFQTYLKAKNRFIRQDAELRADAEFIAAKESVEEGEELYRQRGEELDALTKDIESGSVALEEAQARLDAMTMEDKEPSGADATEPGSAELDVLAESAGEVPGDELDAPLDGTEEPTA